MINKLIDKEQEVAMRIIIHTKKMSKAARLLHTNRKYIYRRHLNQSYNHNIEFCHLSRHLDQLYNVLFQSTRHFDLDKPYSRRSSFFILESLTIDVNIVQLFQ